MALNTEQDRRAQNQDQSSSVSESTKQHDPVLKYKAIRTVHVQL
jgi:hypothetical protein